MHLAVDYAHFPYLAALHRASGKNVATDMELGNPPFQLRLSPSTSPPPLPPELEVRLGKIEDTLQQILQSLPPRPHLKPSQPLSTPPRQHQLQFSPPPQPLITLPHQLQLSPPAQLQFLPPTQLQFMPPAQPHFTAQEDNSNWQDRLDMDSLLGSMTDESMMSQPTPQPMSQLQPQPTPHLSSLSPLLFPLFSPPNDQNSSSPLSRRSEYKAPPNTATRNPPTPSSPPTVTNLSETGREHPSDRHEDEQASVGAPHSLLSPAQPTPQLVAQPTPQQLPDQLPDQPTPHRLSLPQLPLQSPEKAMSTVGMRDIKSLRALAVILARACVFGDTVMHESSPSGKGYTTSQLDAGNF